MPDAAKAPDLSRLRHGALVAPRARTLSPLVGGVVDGNPLLHGKVATCSFVIVVVRLFSFSRRDVSVYRVGTDHGRSPSRCFYVFL